MRRGVVRHRRKALLLGGSDTTVDPAESSFSFDDYDITANGIATATASGVARNAAGAPLAGKTIVDATETITESAANSLVSAAPAEALNNGTASVVLTVQVKDASGRGIPDIPASDITFASTGTGNALTQASASTDQAGNASGSMVSTVAEAKTITATVRGTLITDTATVTFTAAPSAAAFDNEPGTGSVAADLNNPGSIAPTGFGADPTDGITLVTDGDGTNVEKGRKSIVGSGYTGTPALGGANVLRTIMHAGLIGGYGPSRTEHYFTGTPDWVFIGVEQQWPTGYGASTASGGNKMYLVHFTGGGRFFLGFDYGSGNRYWQLWREGAALVTTGTVQMTEGQWEKMEWYLHKGTGAADGVVQLWINGTLAIDLSGYTFPAGNFFYAVHEVTNNGNRPVTGESPEVRVIATPYPGSEVDVISYTSRFRIKASAV